MKNLKRETIPIFFAIDDNYAPFLFVAIQSIVEQASKDYDYIIHILCENLNESNQTNFKKYANDNIKVIITDMTKHIDNYTGKLHTRDYYSKTTYFRIFIPNMFPEYNKAIYLDSDIVLNADISEFYNFDIGDNYVGAVTCEAVNSFQVYTDYAEKFLGFKLPWYFNAGVLLMNLEMMRKINLENRFFDLLSKVKFTVIQDQDYLNVLCRNRVTFLPRTWNKIPLVVDGIDESNVKLIHYNLAFRPWRYDGILFGDFFWKYAKKTVVYDVLLKMKNDFSQKDAAYDDEWNKNLQLSAREHAERENTFHKDVLSGKIILGWSNE